MSAPADSAPAAAAAATASPNKKRKGDDEHPVLPADKEPGMYVNPKFPVDQQSYFSSPTGCILAYTVVYTSDPDRSIAFYESLFGFEVKIRHGKWWTELACGSTSLALHWTGPPKEGAAAAAAKPTAEHGPGSSAPSFFVPDLAAWHEKIKATPHLTVIQAPKKQEWGGSQAVYADPDGLTFSVVEAPKRSDFKH